MACVMMKHEEDGNLMGLVMLQVEDSLMLGEEVFMEEEKISAKEFKSEDRGFLSKTTVNINGIQIRMTEKGIRVSQTYNIQKLIIPDSQKTVASVRSMCQYIGVNSRPDVCEPLQLIGPCNEPTSKAEFKLLEKVIKHLRETKDRGIDYVKLDMKTLGILLFTDSSFANERGLKSQLGSVIVLADKEGRANLVHYGSGRWNRVTKSVMASEQHSLIPVFDNAFTVQHLLKEIIGKPVPIESFVD